jgi:hypothetical protein
MNKLTITIIALLFSVFANAQDSSSVRLPILSDSMKLDKLSIGGGYGYEFGGFGGNVIFYPQRSVGIFLGAGWPLSGFGYNAGVKVRLLVDKSAAKIMPFLLAMYGYNTSLVVKGYPQYDKIFNNVTLGAGADYRPGNSKTGFLSLVIYVPLRDTPGIHSYINNLNQFNIMGGGYSHKLFPISVSLGYKFIIL